MDKQRILTEGELVQWYRIEQVLGRGGFGVTYLATDTNLDHRVAIKEYMPGWAVERRQDNSLAPLNESARQEFELGVSNFLREARTLVKFRHPNIVRVMAVFEANNTAYLVMEYEEGEEFKSYVQRGNGIDERSLTSLILRIVDGLDQVHQYGFLHRDIKPVNLIIRNDGSPVLLDFGAARPTDSEAGAHTAYVSAGYTPIEQYQEGKGMTLGPWTDIYSLGATLYYAISGQTPVGPTGRLAALVQKSPDPLIPARRVGSGRYSESFLEAIDWALSFRPNDRPQNLSQWREALPDADHMLQAYDSEMTVSDLHEELRPSDSRDARFSKASHSKQNSSAGRWVAALFASGALFFAGLWFYGDYQARSAATAMMQEAQQAFNDEDYIDGALPLYRKVLTTEPNNDIARSRLFEIEEIYVKRIEDAIAAGELDRADESLAELREISDDDLALEKAQQRLQLARENEAIEQQFFQARALGEQGKHQQVLSLLRTLGEQRPNDPRLEEINVATRNAIEASEVEARQLAERRVREQKKEAEKRKRTAEANRRQRERRQAYNDHLRSAEQAVADGDIVAARVWLDEARSLQINDDRLSNLESQVVAQENYQRKPLSDYEVSYARGQFNALKQAVESKNLRVIDVLSEGEPSRQRLFDTLFDRYTRLDAKVVDVKTSLDPKRVTAKLRIEAMIQPNGDIVYPSPAYRDSELRLNRERYGWSRIVW